MAEISDVVIIGGTHGNERIGIDLVSYLKAQWTNPFSTFQLNYIEGNPRAIEKKLRFIDYDLNRSFHDSSLPGTAYEKARAEEIQTLITNPMSTFVIDLHTTTSNMGLTWIFSKADLLSRQIGYKAAGDFKRSYILETMALDEDSHYVNRVAKHGLMIEVGPVAQNLSIASVYNDVKLAVLQLLEIIEDYNKKKRIDYTFKLPYFYKEVGVIDYPRDDTGSIKAMIHSDLQGQDYQQLAEKPSFQTFAGEDIFSPDVKRYYPVFINEAAYYEKGIAFMYCDKKPIKHFFGG